MILDNLYKQKLIHPPKWLLSNCSYLTTMGSQAYGVSTDDSDLDVYGFCIPPKDIVFPHLAGIIPGFGNQGERFEQWQEHHIRDPNKAVEYDFSVYSVVKYFQLCMENNPNMIDSLFTPRQCVIHSTPVSEHMRENRKLFLHKGSWHRFKGYAYAQMAKIRNKVNASNPKRAETIAQHGYDLKFAYHIVRLLNEVEQILVEGDLDLQRNREQLKEIRRGEWTLEQVESYFESKEKLLEATYAASKLPHGPDEAVLKKLLLECMEMHYGDLGSAIKRDVNVEGLVRDMRALLDRYDFG
jgi:predicted nucleotidyltransferase